MSTRTSTPPSATGSSAGAIQRAGRILVTIWALSTMVGLAWWMVDDDAVFFALGSLVSLTVTVPLLRKDYSISSPWSLLAVIFYVGCGLRGLAISAGMETTSRSLDDLFLLGRSPEYFVRPGLLFVIAIALMTIAFILTSRRRVKPAKGTWLARYSFNQQVVLLAFPLALIGFIAFAMFVQSTGGINLTSLSAKRTTIGGVNISDDYSSYGELRLLNNLGAIAYWIVVAHYTKIGRRMVPPASAGFVAWGFGINAVLLPIYSSSRTDALFVLLVAMGISHVVRPRRFRLRVFVVAGAALFVLLSSMTLLRASANMGTPVGGSVSALRDSAADTLIYNRNFGDMITSSHIIRNVPRTIPYQNGKTIALWALAPVPRIIWPDKPVVNIGPVIGAYIYGSERSGVPAGLVGDLYLNFGIPAVLVGSLLAGRVLRRIENWRLRHAGSESVAFALLYVPLAIDFAKNLTSKGIGAAAYNSGMQFALTALCLVWVGSTVREVTTTQTAARRRAAVGRA